MACAADPTGEASVTSPYLVTINIQTEEQSTAPQSDAAQPTQTTEFCPSSEDLDSSVVTNWTRPMVLLLIKSYDERKADFTNPTKKKKLLWLEIARTMRCHGYNLTWDACDKKWRNLKKTYCNIVNHNRKTIHGGQSWEYLLQMREILGNNNNSNNKNDGEEKSVIQAAILPLLAVENVIDENVHISNTMQSPQTASARDLMFDAEQPGNREGKMADLDDDSSQKSNDQNIVKHILNRSSTHRRKMYPKVRRGAGGIISSHAPSWVEQYLKKQASVELSRLEIMRDLRTMMRQYVQTQKERNEVLKRFAVAVEKLADK